MKIDIRDLQDVVTLDRKKILSCARAVLKGMHEDGSGLSLVFVNDTYIKNLNLKYRKVNSSTDVLAFPMREGNGAGAYSPVLGDIVISTETAQREAQKRKCPIQKELNLYLVHGILHLLGCDDKNAADRKKMREKEREFLR